MPGAIAAALATVDLHLVLAGGEGVGEVEWQGPVRIVSPPVVAGLETLMRRLAIEVHDSSPAEIDIEVERPLAGVCGAHIEFNLVFEPNVPDPFASPANAVVGHLGESAFLGAERFFGDCSVNGLHHGVLVKSCAWP
jgi:hypothetical protein